MKKWEVARTIYDDDHRWTAYCAYKPPREYPFFSSWRKAFVEAAKAGRRE